MSGFFDDRIVVHTHIEKTAGSSLVRGFIREFGKERVYDIRSSEKVRPEHLDSEMKRSIYLITGHFHYGTQDRHFDRTKVYVACVRPPLQRFYSYYNFVRVRPAHPGYRAMENKSFAQVVTETLTGGIKSPNVMARAVTGVGAPSKQQVFESIENNYAIVSPHDRINDTLRTLLPLLGGRPRRKDVHANKGAGESLENIGELADRFNERNSLDVQLFDHVRERHETWMAELSARIANKREFV